MKKLPRVKENMSATYVDSYLIQNEEKEKNIRFGTPSVRTVGTFGCFHAQNFTNN